MNEARLCRGDPGANVWHVAIRAFVADFRDIWGTSIWEDNRSAAQLAADGEDSDDSEDSGGLSEGARAYREASWQRVILNFPPAFREHA